MEMIITRITIESLKEMIKENNAIFEMAEFILGSIVKEAKVDKKVTVRKVKDLLSIQTELITAFDEDIASNKLSKEQIEERIKIFNVLQEMTKSLFNDAVNVLNKRLNELKDKSINNYEDLSKEELIELLKQKEQK